LRGAVLGANRPG